MLIPTDDTQIAHGGQYTLTVPAAPAQPLSAPSGPEWKEYLEADAFIQSDHPRILSQAKEIVGNEQDVWKKALLINQWVFENLNKVNVVSVPSALEVLQTREGDCNEHTTLFVALARAAGIPSRAAIGLAWSETHRGFYYHAWPEVYAGRWIWMEPTFGQPIADATHIKLLAGNVEKWVQLLPFIGRLKLDVKAVEGVEQP